MKIVVTAREVEAINRAFLDELRAAAGTAFPRIRERLHEVIGVNVRASRAAFVLAPHDARIAAVLVDLLDRAPGVVEDFELVCDAAGVDRGILASAFGTWAHERIVTILDEDSVRVLDIGRLLKAAGACGLPR